jgi:hypothetical protein
VAPVGFDGGEGFVSARSEARAAAGTMLATVLVVAFFGESFTDISARAALIFVGICGAIAAVCSIGVLIGTSFGADK